MTNFAKIVVLAIVAFFAFGIAISLIKSLVALVIPIALLCGLGYVAWLILGKKSLGGGGRSLP
ncbi:MAG: hypothetical protein HONBIEJF_02963 [Fimbriimonadaceae bacterium]|nr:hypothetical protein [Fimbriimonadaceae bacterium]